MKWNEESAAACVKRNGGFVNPHDLDPLTGKTVKSLIHQTPGLGVLGAIDFLVHHCGWIRKNEE
jgi:hypothetical protein